MQHQLTLLDTVGGIFSIQQTSVKLERKKNSCLAEFGLLHV